MRLLNLTVCLLCVKRAAFIVAVFALLPDVMVFQEQKLRYSESCQKYIGGKNRCNKADLALATSSVVHVSCELMINWPWSLSCSFSFPQKAARLPFQALWVILTMFIAT